MTNAGRDFLQDPIVRYLQHGDVRPSPDKLKSYASQFANLRTMSSDIVAADVNIDLAMAMPDDAEHYLDIPHDNLNGVVEQVDHFYDNGYETTVREASEFAVMARLRRLELPLWQAAAEGRPLRMNYSRMLVAAVEAHRIVASPRAQATMVEFMPVLLLARLNRRRFAAGLVGRLSLAREDGRSFIPAGQNPNWVCGFTLPSQRSEFASPPAKVQVKTLQVRKAYKAGIIILKAARYGFASVEQIVDSCLDEQGMKTQYDVPLLGGTDLDTIATRIEYRIITGMPLIRHK